MNKEEIESLFKKYKVRIPKEKQGQSECHECKRHHKYSLTWTSFLYEYKENYYCFEHIAIILLQQENQKLKKQLEYLRSGEYYNQLRFENEMLQQVVDTNGVPSEVYDYIDCTHRNTELLDENQKLKKQLTTYQILHRDCKVDNLKNISKIEEMENQQKEFIEYLENEKDRLVRGCSNVYEDSLGKTRLVNEDIFNEVDTILSKYKSIIGGKDEDNKQ